MPERLPITTYGMEILKKKSLPVKKINNTIITLVENMFFTMRNGDGIGLAAPQVNQNLEIAIVDISCIEKHKDSKPLLMINPKIEDIHGEIVMSEGCLSIPEVRADVLRPEQIFLKYYDLSMNEIKQEYNDLMARVIQHEIDHLNGILFIDHLEKDERKKIKKQLSDIRKGKVNADYPLHIYSDDFHGY
ncbi:MAG TPA: peptide deformylase [Ignavibacteria bacterium]